MLNNMPRYVFFGTPDFAADILHALITAGMPPVAVVTNPDRPAGRKKDLLAPPVKRAAGSIPVLQPEIFDADFMRTLKAQGAEVGVLAAYGKIVPQEVFGVFPKGIVVVHPSLLPRYRGATPIQSVILAGEDITGTTLFVMDEKVDHGPVLAMAQVPVTDRDTYTTLADTLAEASAELILKNLPGYCSGLVTPVPQDEAQATYTKKFSGEDGFVDLEKDDVVVIGRKVRALNPEPGTWTTKNGRRMKILAGEMRNGAFFPTRIQFDGGLPQEV
jgi:methionyl-tRNA formyltransferase